MLKGSIQKKIQLQICTCPTKGYIYIYIYIANISRYKGVNWQQHNNSTGL